MVSGTEGVVDGVVTGGTVSLTYRCNGSTKTKNKKKDNIDVTKNVNRHEILKHRLMLNKTNISGTFVLPTKTRPCSKCPSLGVAGNGRSGTWRLM